MVHNSAESLHCGVVVLDIEINISDTIKAHCYIVLINELVCSCSARAGAEETF